MASCRQGLLVKGKATVQVMIAVQVNGKLSESSLTLLRQGYCPSHGYCPSQWQVIGAKVDTSQWQVVQVRAVACQWQCCMSVASQRHGYLFKLLVNGKLSKARLLVNDKAACQWQVKASCPSRG